MEEKKELKQFGVANLSSDGKLAKTPFSERNKGSTTSLFNTNKTINILIGKGVIIHLDILPNDYNLITTYTGILNLDKELPNIIEGFTPPLYKEFILKGKLLNHVSIGSNVIINPKYKENNKSVRKLEDIYFKSLNNMTVLIGVLDDGELVLYNRLQLCK